jgi:hypothetical protein
MTVARRQDEPTTLAPERAGSPSRQPPLPPPRSTHAAAPHLAALLIALAAFAVGLGALSIAARVAAGRSVASLAPLVFTQKTRGLLLQRAALRRADLLPLYGSSELVRPSRYHALQLFRDRPTGFAVFGVGDRGMPPLITAQTLAALGPALRGRRVVISLSPGMFARAPGAELHEGAYAGNFSRLAADEVAFGSGLSLSLRRRFAARMLLRPEPLAGDPLLHAALRALADSSALGTARYALLLPMGKLQTMLLHRADELRVLSWLASHRASPLPPARPRRIDWDSLSRDAEALARRRGEVPADDARQSVRVRLGVLRAVRPRGGTARARLLGRVVGAGGGARAGVGGPRPHAGRAPRAGRGAVRPQHAAPGALPRRHGDAGVGARHVPRPAAPPDE